MAETIENIPKDLKEKLRNTYNIIAPTYNDWAAKSKRSGPALRLKYLDMLLLHLQAIQGEKHILEIGCGGGVPVTQKLLTLDQAVVTANDLSDEQIATTKRNLADFDTKNLNTIVGDMMTLDFPEASVDCVIGLYSIIHLPLDEQLALFAKIYKWLKPGRFFFANFGVEKLSGQVMENWLHKDGWVFHSSFGDDGTLNELKQIGFEITFTDISQDVADASFLWLLAKKKEQIRR